MRKKSRPGRRQPARPAGKIWIVCALLAVFTAGACGYRFAGGGRLPEGIRTLSVGVFENQTRESGLEHLIANEVIHQFTRFGTVELTDRDSAQAVLTGRIRSVGITTIAHQTATISAERRIRVVVIPTLTASSGRVLWSGGSITDDETFFVGADRLQTDQNKKSALMTLSKRIAERIYYQMTDY
jgi:outer membrane lipopolysaccharide assembly protein LptE/RlpB